MKKPKIESPADVSAWLEKISSQLERLIICQEKRLSGQVIQDFDSKEYLTNK